ncbi:MAG: D-glycero-beta-D-manno-heptose 1,7-bisphosphate 7-phosphatase [Pseudomonas sp.]
MKLLILDRDGVINEDSDAYIKSLEEWIPIPGSIDAIARLSQAGWTIAVATNQSGLARGYYSPETLDAMHARLRELVAAAGGDVGLIVHCPHGPDDACGCRKPLPGLLQQIAQHYGAELRGLWFIGDSASDITAAHAAHCQPVLVRSGKGLRTLAKGIPDDVLVFDNLAAIAAHLLTEEA